MTDQLPYTVKPTPMADAAKPALSLEAFTLAGPMLDEPVVRFGSDGRGQLEAQAALLNRAFAAGAEWADRQRLMKRAAQHRKPGGARKAVRR